MKLTFIILFSFITPSLTYDPACDWSFTETRTHEIDSSYVNTIVVGNIDYWEEECPDYTTHSNGMRTHSATCNTTSSKFILNFNNGENIYANANPKEIPDIIDGCQLQTCDWSFVGKRAHSSSTAFTSSYYDPLIFTNTSYLEECTSGGKYINGQTSVNITCMFYDNGMGDVTTAFKIIYGDGTTIENASNTDVNLFYGCTGYIGKKI